MTWLKQKIFYYLHKSCITQQAAAALFDKKDKSLTCNREITRHCGKYAHAASRDFNAR